MTLNKFNFLWVLSSVCVGFVASADSTVALKVGESHQTSYWKVVCTESATGTNGSEFYLQVGRSTAIDGVTISCVAGGTQPIPTPTPTPNPLPAPTGPREVSCRAGSNTATLTYTGSTNVYKLSFAGSVFFGSGKRGYAKFGLSNLTCGFNPQDPAYFTCRGNNGDYVRTYADWFPLMGNFITIGVTADAVEEIQQCDYLMDNCFSYQQSRSLKTSFDPMQGCRVAW